MGNKNTTQEIQNPQQEQDIYTEKSNVIFKSEDQLSIFEKNVILNFNKILTEKFTNIFNYVCFDYPFYQNVKTTEDLLRESIGDKFIEFINFSDFFKLKNRTNKSSENLKSTIAETAQININIDKDLNMNLNSDCSYDCNKLRLFVFLTTKETLVTNNGYNYNDKALFLYEILSIEDTSNVSFIDISDPKLDETLGCMFDISCIEIIKFFSKEKEMHYENHINVIRGIKEKVVLKVKELIFKYAYEDEKRITYQEFYQIFLENYNDAV